MQLAKGKPPVATQQETVAALLGRSQRKGNAAPIRRTFVQQGPQRKPVPGPLATLVRNRDERALDLYLLLHAVASSEPWDVTESATLWGRALGLHVPGSAESAVSKTWARLEKLDLVRRSRRDRRASVTLLDEGGSGAAYRHPAGLEPYLKLPYQYWLSEDRWYKTLQLPAKAVLLIGLTLPREFILPTEKAPKWYGISSDTAERGLRSLRGNGLLSRRKEFKKAPLAPQGYTEQLVYSLEPPFRVTRK
ncbi:MAG TPA: hypothetical protein VHN37_02325 [Actinomycetota bacterium]|nr:hypothetical protein [Actinomycetota bacterium]